MACSSKPADHRDNFGFGNTSRTYKGHFWPCSVQGHFTSRSGESSNHSRLQPDYRLRPTTKLYMYVKNSFFWRTIHEWNLFPLELHKSSSLCILKNAFRILFLKTSQISFSLSNNYASVHQARMRIGLSSLNFHRRKYNFINEGPCPFCSYRQEHPVHFVTHCPNGPSSDLLWWQTPQLSKITYVDVIEFVTRRSLFHLLQGQKRIPVWK